MDETKKERTVQEILALLETLPPKKRDAVEWVIMHFELAMELCQSETLTPQQREKYQAEAIQNDDSLLWCLVELEKQLHT